jgi:surface protein
MIGASSSTVKPVQPKSFITSSEWFVSMWDTRNTSTGSSLNTQIRLPLFSTGTYNFTVNWGDGTSDVITVWNQAQTTHTYSSPGRYTVIVTGTLQGWRFNNTGDRLKLLEIRQWGTGFRLGNTNGHFYGCSNLVLLGVRDVLNLTGVTSFESIFRNCNNLTSIGNSRRWDTSNITNMSFAFDMAGAAGIFNSDISTWDTSKVTTFRATFQSQPEFNSDISTKEVTVDGRTYIAWDTLNVTEFHFMLNAGNTSVRNNGKFNQPIGNWNTSKATNMTVMFQNQFEFNQDISTKVVTVGGKTYTAWDTLNVTNMTAMFSGFNSNLPLKTGTFNQPIGNWNTSKVTTMNAMFQIQPDFNQDISTKVVTVGNSTYIAWDTANVTTISSLLLCTPVKEGKFNQPIGNWNTTKVTTLNGSFQRQPIFNQDISTKSVTVSGSTYTAWNTSNVTNCRNVFLENKNFNQNIGNWNTAKVTDMTAMLQNTNNFNQNIGNWNVSLVTAFLDSFANGTNLSPQNYDALLIGWASRAVRPNVVIGFGTTKRTSASDSAVTVLTSSPNNWTIIDGGLI